MAEWKYVPVSDWKKGGAYKLPTDSHAQQPGVLWNGTVHPFAPLAMRGLLWYQGERNASAGPDETVRYRSKLHALYNGWAGAFANSAMKLNVVQLCSWGKDIAVFQEEQARFVEENQNAGLVIINDLGNLNDIHPNRKALVGLRLALLALKRDYGFEHLRAESPKPSGVRSDGDVLSFSVVHAEKLYYYSPDKSVCTGFEIAGDDGVFFPAKIINAENDPAKLNFGEIRGTEICLRAREVSAPVKVRYLHSRPWYGCVHNEADLPMGAFHLGY